MQQLGRRAGALDVDLMSIQPEERHCDRLLLRSCMRENMENVRGPRRMGLAWVALISLLSTGDARGANPFLSVCGICCDGRNV